MKTGRVRAIDDATLANVINNHGRMIQALSHYAQKQQRWNKGILAALVTTWVMILLWLFLPYGWLTQLGDVLARWW